MKKKPLKKESSANSIQRKINRRNFISFAGFIGFNVFVFGAWRWLYRSPKEVPGVTAGARQPLRTALEKSEGAFRKTFSHKHLVKTYPKWRAAKKVRVNSLIGMKGNDNLDNWKLAVVRKNGISLNIGLDEIKALPKTEIVFDFKCVEGWDQISYWGGVKFSDFIKYFNLADEVSLNYVSFVTPDKQYYVGIDTESAMHPQTLLAYEVNAQELPIKHGFPLRLIIPVKYGIKNLKRIGTISFSKDRPPDYWAERGYDYYSGL